MSSSYIHSQLSDSTTWEDLKRIFGLRAPTVEKLQANDPHDETVPEGGKESPAQVWLYAGITLHDAHQLWDNLTARAATEEPSNDNADAGNRADPPVAHKSSQK